jgi:tetratricopeptide (TPR) repeat protein
MRWVLRALLVAAVVAAGLAAVRATARDRQFLAGTKAHRAGHYLEALARFVKARDIEGRDGNVWAWIGDAAAGAYLNRPRGSWEPARADELLATAWAGYAGAVLRSPLDTWSWSGLAEIALMRAERKSAEEGVALDDVDRWSRGVLDPLRGEALVAAKIAVALKPSGFQELDVLTRVYASTAQLDAARDAAIRSAEIMPAPSFHAWGEGNRFIRPLYAALIPAMRTGLKRTPEFERSRLHLEIGRFAIDQGDLPVALAEMQDAVATATESYDLYQARRGESEVYEAMGKLQEAIVSLDAAFATGRGKAVDRYRRGVLFAREGRKKEACLELREAVRDLPGDQGLRSAAAGSCEESGETDAAERLLREGFAIPTDSPVLARALLDFYIRTDRSRYAASLARTWERDFPDQHEFAQWAMELGGEP